MRSTKRPIKDAIACFERNPSNLVRFQDEQNIDAAKTILFVSRLLPENRLEMLVDAVATLCLKHPTLTLVIVGPGDNLRSDLESRAKALGVIDRIIFTGPLFEESELARWFLSARVFCYPENMGLSFYHAMHYGVPVITCDDKDKHGPEFRNFVDGTTGLLYETGSQFDLERKLDQILNDEDLARSLSRKSRELATNSLTLEKMVMQFAACIKSVTDER